MTSQTPLNRCREMLRTLGRVVVACSGGVDSSLLLALAVKTLGGENVLAVTATGLFHSPEETEAARSLAKTLHVELAEIDFSDLDDPRILDNPPDRCYWCKRRLLNEIRRLAESQGFRHILTGSNMDDREDYRPGRKAEEELEVVRPFEQAKMGKTDIRAAAKQLGLPNWNRPSQACLASRIPYHTPLTQDALNRIAEGERFLRQLGFSACRLRDHFPVARLELPTDEFEKALTVRDKIMEHLRNLGYLYVTLDMGGLQTGSMNAAL